MRKVLTILTLMLLCFITKAQEFRCAVSINYQKLTSTTQSFETTDPKKFFEEGMKTRIEDFMNQRQWTTLEFEPNEKIDCSISLILSERSTANDFKGQISVQMRRPVYNSNYTSGLFNFIGSNNFQFTYNESQTLEFDPNTYFDNLTATLGFYAYVMLGIYFDSYASHGGEPFFEMARTVQQNTTGHKTYGLSSEDGQKAPYWFMENHTNSAYDELHDAYYLYHRLGLDMMTKDQKAARASIIEALKKLQQVHKKRNNLLSVTQFVDVKIQEIISIFTPAPDDEKREVYFIIKEITPINVTKLKDWKIQ